MLTADSSRAPNQTFLPAYQITKQCEYYAVRLPLLRAGLRRLPFVVSLPPRVFLHPLLNRYPDEAPSESESRVELPDPKASGSSSEELHACRNFLIWARPVKTALAIQSTLQKGLKEVESHVAKLNALLRLSTRSDNSDVLQHLQFIQQTFFNQFDMLQTQLLIRPLHPFQRYNHWPGSAAMIGDKKGLHRNIEKMAPTLGKLYQSKSSRPQSKVEAAKFGLPFIIPTFCLPRERRKLLECTRRKSSKAGQQDDLWIVKPARGSCGRGIFICDSKDERLLDLLKPSSQKNVTHAEESHDSAPASADCVVQKYITNPLLYKSYKFDMRLYVLVTSIDPFVCYKFQEGMVRFAAEPYHGFPVSGSLHGSSPLNGDPMDKFSQLTNYSIGRKYSQKICNFLQSMAESPITTKDLPPNWKPQLKMSLSDFQKWIETENPRKSKGYDTLDGKINDLILSTLLASRKPLLNCMKQEDILWGAARSKSSGFNFSQWVQKWNAIFHGLRDTSRESKSEIPMDLKEIASMQPLKRYVDQYSAKNVSPSTKIKNSCFELYGFDVMIDEKFNPLLIEVNVLPSLESSSGLDYNLKSAVLTDLLNVMCFEYMQNAPRPNIKDHLIRRICRESACPGESGFQRIFPTRKSTRRFESCFSNREDRQNKKLVRVLDRLRKRAEKSVTKKC
ncbi:tubulin-tyrosine ligase-like protein [Perkinsela sp. CCAP 1560/4]|nr:tubulin-tyrosine ligase-like protein [Perkinsela sp. CCAP 1560/4]|eukprot:KNH06291.1 tubulin-tyrosine ligase-like protein [Perkinsela sp. CCAP 1560/4]